MAADTRVSITVDTGNAEGSLNRLRSVFQSLDAAANTASRDIDSAGRATQTAGSRATSAASALTGLSRATTTANSAMTSLHGSTFTYVGNTTRATTAASGLTGALSTTATGVSRTHTAMTSLSSSTTSTTSAVSGISVAASGASAGLASTASAASSASGGLSSAASSSNRLRDALDGMKTIGTAAGIALGAVGFALKGAVDEAIKFESAMADVKKVVNFDSPQGLANMRQDLLDLSTQIPITADGLAQIAAAAGQSGIAANEITKFTEAAAKMGTAFDISAEEAGQAMAEMRTAFKMSQTDVEALADKINYLGNTSPNSAAKIMKIVQTVGPLGELAGVSAAQIAAMGASVNSLAPEVVATGLKNMFLALTKGESVTKSANEAFKKMGLDSVQISKDMQTNSEATINKIIESLKKLPEAERTAAINNIFGAEALPVIAQMVTNTETLTKNLTAVGDATKYAGSMQQEYAARSATTENQLALFNNNLNVLKVNVGSALLPAINQLAQAVIPVMQSMATWAQQNPDLVTQIVAITGAVLGAITVLGGLALAFTAVSSGIAAVSAIAGGVAAAIGAISLPVVAVVAAIAALVTAGVMLYQNWDTVKAKATEIWNSVSDSVGNAVQSIADWFRSAGQEIQNEFNVIGNIVSNGWQSVQNFFSKWSDEIEYQVDMTWQAIKGAVSQALTNIASNIQSQFNSIKSIVTSAWSAIQNASATVLNAMKAVVQTVLGAISTLFTAQFNVIKTVVSTVMNAIKALVQGDMQGVKNAFSSGFAAVVGIVKTAVSNIVSAFSNLGSQLFNIGVQAVQGLANGIKSRIESVGAEARNLASNVANSIKSALDIHSPSRVTHALGEHAGQGLANGLKAKQSEVAKQAAQLSQQVIDNIASLKRDIALVGKDNNPLAALNYDIENGKYAGVSSSLLDNLKTATEAKQIATELYQANQNVSNSIADMNRQIALFSNDNPLSAFLYDMQNTDKYVGATAEKLQMIASKIQQLEALKQAKASEDAFSKLGTDLNQESPMAKLTAEYEQRMAIVDQYEQLHTDKVAQAAAMRNQVEQSYGQAKANLMLSSYESMFGGMSDILKMFGGENRKSYMALLAIQKGYVLQAAFLNNKKAISDAWATDGNYFTKAIAVGKVILKNQEIMSAITSFSPKGFSTGGYTGNVGVNDIAGVVHGKEYVLNAAATKRIGVDNLNAMNRGASVGTKVIVNNYSNENATVEKSDNGDIMVTIGKMVKDVSRVEARNVVREELGQNGMIARKLR